LVNHERFPGFVPASSLPAASLSVRRTVADCRDWALPAVEATGKASDPMATIRWIDASDP
jgi:hypothetical protein